jgi:hypothetical protein
LNTRSPAIIATILTSAALTHAALGAAAPSTIPDTLARFDLVCSGEARTLAGPKIPDDWTRTYSVDLVKGRWCDRSEGCDHPRDIAGLQGDIIILERISENNRLTDLEVSRATGAMIISFDLGRAAYQMRGDCRTAAYEAIDPGTPGPGD